MRVLEHRIKRTVIMAQGARLIPEGLELSSPLLLYEGRTLKEAREVLEKDLI